MKKFNGYEIKFREGCEYTDRKGRKWKYDIEDIKYNEYELTKLYFDTETCEYYNERVDNHRKINFRKILWEKRYNDKRVYTEEIEIYDLTAIAWKDRVYKI